MKIVKVPPIKITVFLELLICLFYTWYFLPVCQAMFWTNTYKVAFFLCFLVGIVGLAFFNGFRVNGVVLPIVLYMLVFTLLYLLDVDDANAHIRVSFTFWGTALLYFGVLDDEGRIRIGKYLLILFIVTALTSAYGVITDNNAARTIAHASADDELQVAYKMKNIANIYLFQMLVMIMPPMIILSESLLARVATTAVAVGIIIILVNASFTISLIVYVFAVLLSISFKGKQTQRVLVALLISIPIAAVLMNGDTVLTYLGDIINNDRIAVRLYGLRDLIYSGSQNGNVGLRWELYLVSTETFFDNLFGVGVHYSYHRFENGIGYHSQFLDDLARFGLFGLAFYVSFIKEYYKHLRNRWKEMGYPQVALVVVVLYSMFLLLNLGFRSADESVMMLFIMPVLPLLLTQNQTHKLTK